MNTNAKLEFLEAFTKVQGLVEPAKTDSKNPHFGSKYASLSAVNEAVMGILNENGFSLLSGGQDINGKPYLRTTLYHIAGHEESFYYPLVVSDNPQHTASSVTYSRRYSICALLNLSIEDDDANAASGTKTVTREPASYTEKKSADKAAVTQAGEVEIVKFVPSDVQFVEGTGKGAGKTFSEIYDGSKKYGGNEIQGQLAESARAKSQQIAVAFKRNGKYLNIISGGGVKIALDKDVEDVQF